MIETEFLYRRGAPADSKYVFKHALIREAAYDSLLKSTRHEYHQRIARVMVSEFSAEAEAQPEFVAMHFTEGGEAAAAVQWWQRAGRHAFSHATYMEAATDFTRGLDLLKSMPALPSATSRSSRWKSSWATRSYRFEVGLPPKPRERSLAQANCVDRR